MKTRIPLETESSSHEKTSAWWGPRLQVEPAMMPYEEPLSTRSLMIVCLWSLQWGRGGGVNIRISTPLLHTPPVSASFLWFSSGSYFVRVQIFDLISIYWNWLIEGIAESIGISIKLRDIANGWAEIKLISSYICLQVRNYLEKVSGFHRRIP